MNTYRKIDGGAVDKPLTSQQQDRAEGLAFAQAWRRRGGAQERWLYYAAAHAPVGAEAC
jgi:hypothetical protein